MKERSILFSAPMVRALIEGRKTVTRRVVKLATPPTRSLHDWSMDSICVGRCPYGQPSDRLWVREAWRTGAAYDACRPAQMDSGASLFMVADGCAHRINRRPEFGPEQWGRYRHARFMPRWASRITLEVTGVRVERLQDITREGAASEGMCMDLDGPLPDWFRRDRWPEENFAALWDQINGSGSWHANPWVWAVEFKRVEAQQA